MTAAPLEPPARRWDDAVDLLLHPVLLASLVLLVVNDHVLKDAWGNVLTGKLSDVASLVVAPIVVAVLARLALPRAIPMGTIVRWSCLAVGLLFVGMQASGAVDEFYARSIGLGQWLLSSVTGTASAAPGRIATWPDLTDLLVLPTLAVPLHLANSHLGNRHLAERAGFQSNFRREIHPLRLSRGFGP